jgi:hypothetical protein
LFRRQARNTPPLAGITTASALVSSGSTLSPDGGRLFNTAEVVGSNPTTPTKHRAAQRLGRRHGEALVDD